MEKRPTKQGWFIGAQKRFELACWEQWTLAVTVAEEANTEMALKAALGRIFQLADAKIDHIPPITAELASEFLYQAPNFSLVKLTTSSIDLCSFHNRHFYKQLQWCFYQCYYYWHK